MVAKAAERAAKAHYANVVFKVGRMAELPLDHESVDVVISNCVINHAADKVAVFKDVFRCLKPHGRVLVTDLMAEGPFSEAARQDKMWGEWLAAASGKKDYLTAIEGTGFRRVVVVSETAFPMAEADERLRGRIVSLAVKAWK
jgi:ubiquinone/menaquinone biosynthesis C-methylase UbiE